jgi:hypothetical protein
VSQHPALIRAIASDRVADLRHASGCEVRDHRDMPGVRMTWAVRRAAGWLLVDLGLRIALPRRAVKHPVARRAANP